MQNTDKIWTIVDTKQAGYIELSDRVFEMPELNYREVRSAAAHAEQLRREGFRVETGIAGLPTAVMGEAGEDGPVIAILGEYDALPELSQAPGVSEHQPLPNQPAGHGCGHNLLGAGAMLAAAAVKDFLAERGSRAASATMAARQRKAEQARPSWSRRAPSGMSTSRSHGIRRISRL